jgi:predicted dehydrogenase
MPPSKPMINVGVIGCGYWGPNLIRNFSALKGCRMHSCADMSKERLLHMEKLYPSIQTTSNYKDIIGNKEIHAVVIATPVSTHYKFAKEALENEKHVLVEKPITTTSKEAKGLIALAKKKKKVLMVDHTFEYSAPVMKAKELIENGQLGTIYTIDMVRVNLGLFQKDINVVQDLLPHDASILMYLLGEKPISLRTVAQAYIQKGIEDSAHIVLKFKNKAMATVHVSWLTPQKVRKITIVGSKKMLVYDDLDTKEKLKLYDKGVSIENAKEVGRQYYDTFAQFKYLYRSGEAHVQKVEETETLQNVCRHFIDCIENHKAPLSDGESGLRVVKVLEAAQQSLKKGGEEVQIDW